MASLEERCASLKSTIEQLKLSLEKASATESELKSEINLLQHNVMEITTTSQSNNEKLKQVREICILLHNERFFIFSNYKSTSIYLILAAETTVECRK